MLISEKQVLQMFEICKLVFEKRLLIGTPTHRWLENFILQFFNQQSDELVKVGDLKEVQAEFVKDFYVDPKN